MAGPGVSPDERRRRQQQDMLKAVQLWITQEGLILPDLERLSCLKLASSCTSTDPHRVNFRNRSRARMNSFP